MTWGLPPKITEKKKILSLPQDKIIDRFIEVVKDLGFDVLETSAHTINAKKKMPFTFFSVFNFTRPKIELYVLCDEDKNATLKLTFGYTDRQSGAFNDFGKLKKEAKKIFSKIN